METSTFIAAMSAIGTLLATLSAVKSYLVSKKALQLSENQHTAKKSNILGYLADSFVIYDTNKEQKKYIFSVTYSNKSEK